MLAFPASPTVGQQFQTWTWDGVKWTPTPTLTMPDCGYLRIVGSSPAASIIFVPFNGDLIRINGINYHIPAAGITVTYNNAFVNGVAGQTLTNGTTYSVYAFIHPTLGMQLDFGAVGQHSPSTAAGNVGTEIKNGDNSRSLVGNAYFSVPASAFYDQPDNRLTRSWFNRRPAPYHVGGGMTVNQAAWVLYLNGSVVSFQNESVTMTGQWYGTGDTQNNMSLSVGLSGSIVGYAAACSTLHTTGAYENVTALWTAQLNEGLNSIQLYGHMGAGSAGGNGGLSGMVG